jgi:hypothetical protein
MVSGTLCTIVDETESGRQGAAVQQEAWETIKKIRQHRNVIIQGTPGFDTPHTYCSASATANDKHNTTKDNDIVKDAMRNKHTKKHGIIQEC